jgi:hypothetical protein
MQRAISEGPEVLAAVAAVQVLPRLGLGLAAADYW